MNAREEMIRAGFKGHVTEFLVGTSVHDAEGMEGLLAGINSVKGYNEFYGEDVMQAVRDIAVKHLKSLSQIHFGREGSPVLYIYTKNDQKGVACAKRIEQIMENMGADEVDSSIEFPNIKVRAWWD